MRRIIFTAVAWILLTMLQYPSQAQSWKWAHRHGGDSIESAAVFGTAPFQYRLQDWNSVVDLATDAQNNIYAVSQVLSKYLDLNGLSPNTYGKSDILLSSYTCDGVLRWSKVIGSNQDSDAVIGVRCDEMGVYVSGMTSSNYAAGSTGCHFSTDTITGNMTKNFFLAKWDFAGRFQWLRMPQPDTISPPSVRRSALIDMDANATGDTVYLFCYLTPGAYAGGLYQALNTGAYVLKYTRTGAFAGGVSLPYQQQAPAITLYESRWSYNRPLNQFVASGRSGTALGLKLDIAGTKLEFGWGYLASFDASSGGLNYLVMDTNRHATRLLRKVAIDQNGDMYLSGNAGPGTSFNGVSFPNSLGTYLGPFNQTYAPFIMKINGKTGTPIWTCKSQATSAYGLNICLGKKDLLLTGEYSGTLAFPTASISNSTSVDTADAFIAFLDTATGAVRRLNALKAKRPLPLIFNTIILDKKGSFICGGSFNDTLVLGNTTIVETHPASGPPGRIKRYDAWLGKFGYNNCNCNISATYKNVSSYGTTGFFTYTGSTNIDSLVWNWGDGTQSGYKNNFTATISHSYAKTGRYQVCVTAYNDTCADSQHCGMLPLAISNSLLDGVRVYPNPAMQDLYIEGLSGGSARIVSVTGQTLLDVAIRREKQPVSIGHLPPGYYLILFQDKAGRSGQQQFVKE